MEYEIIEHICISQMKLNHFISRIYRAGALVKFISFDMFDDETIEPFDLPLPGYFPGFDLTKSVSIYSCGTLALGYIKDNQSDYSIVIGPIRFGEIVGSDLKDASTRFQLPQIVIDQLRDYLTRTPIMSLVNFLTYLSMLNAMINQTIVSFSEITAGSDVDTVDVEFIDNRAVNIISAVKDYQADPHISHNYEDALVYYIRNGLVNEITRLDGKSYPGRVGKMAPTYLRSMKNAVISLNTLSLRAAISGGLDYETAYTVGELYAQRIENCQSISELTPLSSAIRRDYCRRVHELKQPKISDPLALQATEYINEHLYTKLTANALAEVLNISPAYLSVRFKKAIGCTIPQYINQQKVVEAKKLLRFTTKSLVEISDMLCFSSQSHFQNQFKKLRGITPMQYRESYQKH